METCWQAMMALCTPTPRFCCCFVFKELVCSSAWGHLILKTTLGKSNLISKGVSAGIEETKSSLMWTRVFSSLQGAQTAAVLMERAMAVMNMQGFFTGLMCVRTRAGELSICDERAGIFTGLICVHTREGELSRQNCYFGLLLGYSYSTGNMFKKYFH